MEYLQIILATLKQLDLVKRVNFIFLYGSVSRNEQTPLSDVDICLSLSLNPKQRLNARMKLLGNLPDNFDIQIYEDLPVYVQKEVLAGTLLYYVDEKKVYEQALKTISDFDDFEPIY